MITWKLRSQLTGRKTSICMSDPLRPDAICRGLAVRSAIILLSLIALITTSARGAIATDAAVSKDNSTASATITSPAFSTATPNELLLAFIATDYVSGTNTTVKSISGGGLTWTLVQRANAQSGSAEIWRAFAASTLSNATVAATLSQSVVASMTVMSFAGVNHLRFEWLGSNWSSRQQERLLGCADRLTGEYGEQFVGLGRRE